MHCECNENFLSTDASGLNLICYDKQNTTFNSQLIHKSSAAHDIYTSTVLSVTGRKSTILLTLSYKQLCLLLAVLDKLETW